MRSLRQMMLRAVRKLPRLVTPALVVASAAGSGLAVAGTRSHLHHASVAPLPPSSFVETDAPRGNKKHRGGTYAGAARSESRPSSASGAATGKSRSGKAGKGHGGRAKDPATDAEPIRMYRTNHPVSPSGRYRGVPDERTAATSHSGHLRNGAWEAARERKLPALQDQPVLRNEARRDQSRYGQLRHDQPILVDAHGRPVSPARFAAMRRGAPSVHWVSSTGAARGAAADSGSYGAVTSRNRSASSLRYATAPAHTDTSSPAAFADAHANSFATGIAHPPEDDALPRLAAAGAGPKGSAANLGSALVMTPGALRTQGPAPATASPVVQGFGAEVALAPTDAGRVPGATRRRDHPIPASALPGMAPVANSAPQSLEDRDAITLAAVSPAVLPDIYDRDGRLLMPAPLKGSREVLLHQNTMAANDGLGRIQDDYELDRLRAEHALLNFPVGSSLHVNEDLPYNRRCARPWTVLFATDIARDFYERFHQPLVVTSAVRTVSYQARLQRVNGNAAATEGDLASPHLTGPALAFAKRGMNQAELAWMRAYLMPLISAGKIDVEEEFQQACFHISVYRHYAGGRLPAHEVAQVKPAGTAAPNGSTGTDPRTNP